MTWPVMLPKLGCTIKGQGGVIDDSTLVQSSVTLTTRPRLADAGTGNVPRRSGRGARATHRVIPQCGRVSRPGPHLFAAGEPVPEMRRGDQAVAERAGRVVARTAGRCANCKARISAGYPIVEAITGVTFAVVTWWDPRARPRLASQALTSEAVRRRLWALGLVIVAFLYFAAISILLTLIDLDTRRLPNSIVLPSYLSPAFFSRSPPGLGGDWAALLRAGIGMAALYAFYFVLRLVRPGGMGGGDVKLAGLIGIYLGWLGGAHRCGRIRGFRLRGIVRHRTHAREARGAQDRHTVRPVDDPRRLDGSIRRRSSRSLVVELFTGA